LVAENENLVKNFNGIMEETASWQTQFAELKNEAERLRNEYAEAKKVFEIEMKEPFDKWIAYVQEKQDILRKKGLL
jgi:predicted  nucleic acid-binding Zn-ribbon protein